jgi:hypothetical protein
LAVFCTLYKFSPISGFPFLKARAKGLYAWEEAIKMALKEKENENEEIIPSHLNSTNPYKFELNYFQPTFSLPRPNVHSIKSKFAPTFAENAPTG